MNKTGDKEGSQDLEHALPRYSRLSLVTRLPSMTVAVMFLFYVTEDMVGHKLGEFAPTRTFRGHSGIQNR